MYGRFGTDLIINLLHDYNHSVLATLASQEKGTLAARTQAKHTYIRCKSHRCHDSNQEKVTEGLPSSRQHKKQEGHGMDQPLISTLVVHLLSLMAVLHVPANSRTRIPGGTLPSKDPIQKDQCPKSPAELVISLDTAQQPFELISVCFATSSFIESVRVLCSNLPIKGHPYGPNPHRNHSMKWHEQLKVLRQRVSTAMPDLKVKI